VAFRTGEGPRRYELNRQALVVLESLPASQEVVDALVAVSGDESLLARPKEGLLLADRAVALALAEGFDPSGAYSRRALARFGLGDAGCIDDYRAAIEHGGSAPTMVVGTAYANLAMALGHVLGPAAMLEAQRTALAFGQARGSALLERWVRPGLVEALINVGRLDDALEEAAAMAAPAYDLVARGMLQGLRARVAAVRRAPPDGFDLDELVDAGRRLDDPQWLASLLGWGAAAAHELGQPSLARELIVELLRDPLVGSDTSYVEVLPSLVRAALAAGDDPLARRLVEAPSDALPLWAASVATARTQIAESRSPADAVRGYEDAVGRWRALGDVPELSYGLVGWARCLLATGRHAEARPMLAEAREQFVSMGADLRATEVDGLAG
jgi:hypothetical protein